MADLVKQHEQSCGSCRSSQSQDYPNSLEYYEDQDQIVAHLEVRQFREQREGVIIPLLTKHEWEPCELVFAQAVMAMEAQESVHVPGVTHWSLIAAAMSQEDV